MAREAISSGGVDSINSHCSRGLLAPNKSFHSASVTTNPLSEGTGARDGGLGAACLSLGCGVAVVIVVGKPRVMGLAGGTSGGKGDHG